MFLCMFFKKMFYSIYLKCKYIKHIIMSMLSFKSVYYNHILNRHNWKFDLIFSNIHIQRKVL